MKQPKISVVLPCYNHSAFLRERISSVLSQTLPVSQIIFLDDASTDQSLALAKELLADTRIDVEFHSNRSNSGTPFAQWNKGLHLAKHPYVWIAETDDTCKPNLLAELVSAIAHKDATIAFSQSRKLDEHGNDLGSLLPYTDGQWPEHFAASFVMPGLEFNSKFMSVINAIPNASAALFRRSALSDRVCANESMRFCGDWDFWIRIAEQGCVAYVAEELNGFRCHHQTTRAKGRTSQALSEILACRLRAFFRLGTRHESAPSLDALVLLRLCCSEDRSSMLFILGQVELQNLLSVRACYSSLLGAPSISLGAWIFIFVIGLGKVLRRRVLSLIHCSSSR